MFTDIDALWKKAVEFHGHACPGLAIGCRMVMDAAAYLGLAHRSRDEEIVCISETDACCVDAAQALLGCTLGKGNLFLRPRGKAAMSFFDRRTGKGCRALRMEREDLGMSREKRMAYLLSPEGREHFTLTPRTMPELPEALLGPSIPCARCGERTAEFMLRRFKDQWLCMDCAPAFSRIL